MPAREHRAHDAVVAEAVGGTDCEDARRRIVEEGAHLGGPQPQRRLVELVGAQGQLGEPGHLGGARLDEPDLDPPLPQAFWLSRGSTTGTPSPAGGSRPRATTRLCSSASRSSRALAPAATPPRAAPATGDRRVARRTAWQRQGVEDERPARGLREPRDQPRQRPDPLPCHPLHVLGPPGHGDLVEDHHRVKHTVEHAEGQIGPVQLAAPVGEVEDVRVKVREMRPQQQLVAGQFHGQGRQQRCQRAVPGDGDDRHGRMLHDHLVRIEPRQQLPGPGEFGVRGAAEQLPNAGVLTDEPPCTVQIEQRRRPALHRTFGAGCACHGSPCSLRSPWARHPVRGAGR
ncbi:hypothetical protein O3Q52_03190 [Streptomyces sp. ActVer]|uniref:hypothetical protein n=1 Tax=Streptomyces sp. ActVer TaxID=3014558 RepID=UPI0022B457FB|nr:hypothetical protein [Streptomyces sp. ActVer]MCZ4507225.1 hypothetical protein [Streptomyces sp. ActVer]